MKKKLIIVMSFIIIVIAVLIGFSYFGLFFFKKGFNNFDYLFFDVFGSSILVGISTYIATDFISIKMEKMNFKRENRIEMPFNKISPQILNYKNFIECYLSSNFQFSILSDDKELLDRVFKKYIAWSFLKSSDYQNNSDVERILNYPFNFSYLFNHEVKFIDSWKNIMKICEKENSNINVITKILDEADYKDFEKFSNMINKMRFYELINLNNNKSFRGILTADKKVINKIDLLPGQKKIFGMYFDKNKFIDYIIIIRNFENEEEAKTILGFKYEVGDEINKPININLEDYMKVT